MIDILTDAFATAFLIIGVAKLQTRGPNLPSEIGMYLLFKVAPVAVGLKFAFDLYARYMGWPV